MSKTAWLGLAVVIPVWLVDAWATATLWRWGVSETFGFREITMAQAALLTCFWSAFVWRKRADRSSRECVLGMVESVGMNLGTVSIAWLIRWMFV